MQRKALLSSLFKLTSVDFSSTEDPRNFPRAAEAITLIRNIGGNLIVWDHLAGAKDSFPQIKMDQIGSPDLKKMAQMCSGMVYIGS